MCVPYQKHLYIVFIWLYHQYSGSQQVWGVPTCTLKSLSLTCNLWALGMSCLIRVPLLTWRPWATAGHLCLSVIMVGASGHVVGAAWLLQGLETKGSRVGGQSCLCDWRQSKPWTPRLVSSPGWRYCRDVIVGHCLENTVPRGEDTCRLAPGLSWTLPREFLPFSDLSLFCLLK